MDRRGFAAKLAAMVMGVLAGLVPLGAGLAVFFDPLRRVGESVRFHWVTTLSAVPEDGRPRRFAIVADRTDAWNKHRNVPVGAVYLRRVEGGKVEALNVTCPHAGCAVAYRVSSDSFLCPCHDSAFHLNGSLADPDSPSPRAMDALEVEVRHGQEVWVRYQNFEPGKAQKVAVS